MRRVGGLAAALTVGDALQRSIQSQQARVADERGRQRQRVWESQGAVAPSQLGSSSRESTVDIDDVRADRGEELIDRAVCPVLEGFDDHLGVDRCRNQDVIAAGKVFSEQLNRPWVLSV
jgi:hypothetical protein